MSIEQLPTTSYAILGQLTLGPWSAYELTQQMQRAAAQQVWPCAESRIYDQLKRLADLGYASVARQATGRRQRSVYTITADGRTALGRWLDSDDAAPYRIEDEIVLRLNFLDSGTIADLRRNLERGRRHLIERLEHFVPLTEELARGEGKFPERSHISALMAGAAHRELTFRADLYDWFEAVVADWTSTDPDPERLGQALRSLEDAAQSMAALLDEQRRRILDDTDVEDD